MSLGLVFKYKKYTNSGQICIAFNSKALHCKNSSSLKGEYNDMAEKNTQRKSPLDFLLCINSGYCVK